MRFMERIIRLHEERNLPQRKVTEVFDVDLAIYCEIKK